MIKTSLSQYFLPAGSDISESAAERRHDTKTTSHKPELSFKFDVQDAFCSVNPFPTKVAHATKLLKAVEIKSCGAVGELRRALVTDTWGNAFTLLCSHVSNNTCTDTYMHTQTHTPIQSGLLQTHIPY